jgi:hypothetical protein
MGSIKVKKRNRYIGKKRRIPSAQEISRGQPDGQGTILGPDGIPIKFGIGSSGPGSDPEGKFGKEIPDLLSALNEAGESLSQRRWLIRVILVIKAYPELDKFMKKVGVFVMRPMSPTMEESENIIHLLDNTEAEIALEEARSKTQNIHKADHFFLEEPGDRPSSLPELNRERLVDLVIKRWKDHPVNTMGDVDFWYEKGTIRIPREDMISTVGREKILDHLIEILDQMTLGFRYDPWTKSIRRVGEEGIGPWAYKR